MLFNDSISHYSNITSGIDEWMVRNIDVMMVAIVKEALTKGTTYQLQFVHHKSHTEWPGSELEMKCKPREISRYGNQATGWTI